MKLVLKQNWMFMGRIPPRGSRMTSGCLNTIAFVIMVTKPPIKIGSWLTCARRVKLANIKVAALRGQFWETQYMMKSSSMDTKVMFTSFLNRE